MGENIFKFLNDKILKELVVIISNESILINTFFHCEIIWIKMWYLKEGVDDLGSIGP